MSFSNLMSGAECSTSANPLGQFSKHVGQDKSLQRDRFVPGTAPAGGMRSDVPLSAQDRKVACRYPRCMLIIADDGSVLPSRGAAKRICIQPDEKRIDQYPTTLIPPHSDSAARYTAFLLYSILTSPEWLSEFSRSGAASPLQLRPEERTRMEHAFQSTPISANPAWQQEFLTRPPQEVAQHFHTMPPASDAAFMRDYGSRYDMYSGPGLYTPPPVMTDLKGKSKLVELDDSKWEEQFAAFEDSVKDDEANKAIDDELNAQEGEQFFGDFQSIWNGIQAEQADKLAAGDTDFLDQFSDVAYDSNDLFDGKPDLGDYLFEPDNPYMTHADPFTEGKRLMEMGGSLSEAALCFEAVCQLESKRVEGWTNLGAVQAQNEKELAAIRALEQAIRLDETNLPALMVSSSQNISSNCRILQSRIQMKGTIRRPTSLSNNGCLPNIRLSQPSSHLLPPQTILDPKYIIV
jgi:hypothetical protein